MAQLTTGAHHTHHRPGARHARHRSERQRNQKNKYRSRSPDGGFCGYLSISSDNDSAKENIDPNTHTRSNTLPDSGLSLHSSQTKASSSCLHSPVIGWGRDARKTSTPCLLRTLADTTHSPEDQCQALADTQNTSARWSEAATIGSSQANRDSSTNPANPSDGSEGLPICSQWSITSRSPQK